MKRNQMPWTIGLKLENEMRENPVVEHRKVTLDCDVVTLSDDWLKTLFPNDDPFIRTWDRRPGFSTMFPHWLICTYGIYLHTDQNYPDYCHHLVLRSDGFALRGVDGQLSVMERGDYIVFHSKSPHELFPLTPDAKWYFAASIDNDRHCPSSETIPLLLDYVQLKACEIPNG